MSKLHLNIMGARRIYFIISAVLVVASVIALATIGLNFGVEFQG